MTIQTMEKKRQNLRQKISEKEFDLASGKQAEVSGQPLTEKEALPGTSVRIKSMNLTGTIAVRPDNRGYVSVQCGIITSKVHLSDLVKAAPEETATNPANKKSGKASKYSPLSSGNSRQSGSQLDLSRASGMSTEINVLGMTVDEAVAVIDKHIDNAYLCHLPGIRIIHGKGTGALRKGIHAYLDSCPYIRTYHLAAQGEGDAGVTIVEF